MKTILAALFAVMIGLSFVGSTFAQAPAPAPSTGDQKAQGDQKEQTKEKKGKRGKRHKKGATQDENKTEQK